MNKIDIKSMTIEELEELLISFKQPKFRAKQIFDWLHVKKVLIFAEMSNLPKSLIEVLDESCTITNLSIKRKLVSQIDETTKYLFELPDSEFVESVVMKYKHGNSICISTQVGCKMGCAFCASTKAGFVRNLTPSEILEQIYAAGKDIGERISNVVLMGIGEPLDNYDNVIRFLNLLSNENGHNLSLRHVSLSTCGVVDKIYELARLKLGLTLSISLHAPNDQIRSQTMPINNRFNMDELLKACKEYANTTSRRISFEYALIRGVNDSEACANELASKLKGMLCHVNLIPVNEIKETDFKKTYPKNVVNFQQWLVKKGINTTIRRTLGADISAACGQLRRDNL
ncbi:23S rRNA (adenine(2503)-C(2))-methyltransferase RlmN [Paludicola sp. MB14-C6]|uniref:23S rRNA (adenine(2503)-C(2))-methyltransferase RlmN n=1 Tax=Paludihabitans sp. MB14-C6 TaxID=3070656 RepID=UPI0027DD43A4|nr:23S rRNA (adenine(2503)-C(2))-methyltransferase RlmN [Paludicola sp. MB14-C6]WMJ22381.1 23S rRNA (adenine(2503)-C(2))-methyltransferase RlmN [Paludicola sp. MB14-C6]